MTQRRFQCYHLSCLLASAMTINQSSNIPGNYNVRPEFETPELWSLQDIQATVDDHKAGVSGTVEHAQQLLDNNREVTRDTGEEQQYQRLRFNTSDLKVRFEGVRQSRALCRINLLPVTHVLVDTWMLTVKLVYNLSNVPDDLKWTTNTHDTIYTHFQGITNNIYGFGRLLLLHFLPIHHPSTHITARPHSFLPVLMTGERVST